MAEIAANRRSPSDADYNHSPALRPSERANNDASLTTTNAARTPRDYLGGSRLPCLRTGLAVRVHACAERRGPGTSAASCCRIFAVGQSLRFWRWAWLRGAGFDLYTRKGQAPEGPVSASRSPVAAASVPCRGNHRRKPRRLGLRPSPRCGKCKRRIETPRTGVLFGGSPPKKMASPNPRLGLLQPRSQVYQAYMDATIPASPAPALSPPSTRTPPRMHHELVPFIGSGAAECEIAVSDPAGPPYAGELLAACAKIENFFECRFCPWGGSALGGDDDRHHPKTRPVHQINLRDPKMST